jgi:hypothetical protein
VLEPAQAASALVSSETGGTLTATGANGTRYTLVLPPGGLVSDETITMTPVSSVGSSPLGTLLGAVDLEPNGLQLVTPATLTIVPPGPVSRALVAGFDAAGGGQDFALHPLNRGTGIVMSLWHFSTDGVADASAAQVQASLSDQPLDPVAQWDEFLASVTNRPRLNVPAIAPNAVAYYRDVLGPLIRNALTNDTYAESALGAFIAWEAPLEKFGFADDELIAPLVKAGEEAIEAIFRNAVSQRYRRCVSEHDLSEIASLLSTERQAAILDVDLGAASDDGEKCGHFELDVTTSATQTTDTGDDVINGQIGVEDDIPISAGDIIGHFSGQADPTYTNWQFSLRFATGETTNGTSVNAPSMADFTLDDNVVQQKNPQTGQIIRTVPAPTLVLDFNPGQTRELWSFEGSSSYLTVWDDTWNDGHLLELLPFTEQTFQIENWQTFPPGSGSLVAMKSYPTRTFCRVQLNCNPATSPDNITETTTLKLYHRPQS